MTALVPIFGQADWLARICAAWRQSVTSIIETGRLLSAAKAALPHGEWGNMVERLPFGERATQALMAIGADPWITQHVAVLPPHWGTLAEIQRLDVPVRNAMLESKVIHPGMERREVPAGARAIMSSRVAPAENLDFFPTAPWGTRALIVHVFSALPECQMRSVSEPACGEGHMAEVLREEFGDVLATDIHPYGYSERPPCDFLSDAGDIHRGRDWIITNPPFQDCDADGKKRDRTLEFVLRALDRAKVGVAMLVRSQWAVEGVGRYERLYRRRPPTLMAFFSERLPIWEGQWNPKGGTATAYCWLVWVKDSYPLAPFWIPPGCRKSLEHPGDRERFTAHPVIRKEVEPAKVIEKPVAKPPLPDVEIPEMLRGVGV